MVSTDRRNRRQSTISPTCSRILKCTLSPTTWRSAILARWMPSKTWSHSTNSSSGTWRRWTAGGSHASAHTSNYPGCMVKRHVHLPPHRPLFPTGTAAGAIQVALSVVASCPRRNSLALKVPTRVERCIAQGGRPLAAAVAFHASRYDESPRCCRLCYLLQLS